MELTIKHIYISVSVIITDVHTYKQVHEIIWQEPMPEQKLHICKHNACTDNAQRFDNIVTMLVRSDTTLLQHWLQDQSLILVPLLQRCY